jgi:tryptophan-rich sensory protein
MKNKLKTVTLSIMVACFAMGVSYPANAAQDGKANWRGSPSLAWYCFAPYLSSEKWCRKYNKG